MMFNEAQAILSRITYKPGWVISIYEGDEYYFRISVSSSEIPSVFNSRQTIRVTTSQGISKTEFSLIDIEHLIDMIKQTILKLETHEAMEWFQLDGKQIVPQHT